MESLASYPTGGASASAGSPSTKRSPSPPGTGGRAPARTGHGQAPAQRSNASSGGGHASLQPASGGSAFTPIKPSPSPEGPACRLHKREGCEWCALGVKTRTAFGRDWPYAEHPLTRYHYCLEPVELPTGGLAPCCALRSKPIKTSQGYSGHLATHRTGPSGLSHSSTSNGNSANGHANSANGHADAGAAQAQLKRPRTVSSSSMHGGFMFSLQPSLPRCDLDKDLLRVYLLPQDSKAPTVQGHRGKITRNAVQESDNIYTVSCPSISELLPPNDSRTTFEVSVRVYDSNSRLLFQTSILCDKVEGWPADERSHPALNEPVVTEAFEASPTKGVQKLESIPRESPAIPRVEAKDAREPKLVTAKVEDQGEPAPHTNGRATEDSEAEERADNQRRTTEVHYGLCIPMDEQEKAEEDEPSELQIDDEDDEPEDRKAPMTQKPVSRKRETADVDVSEVKQSTTPRAAKRMKTIEQVDKEPLSESGAEAASFNALAELATIATENAEPRTRGATMSEILQAIPPQNVAQMVQNLITAGLSPMTLPSSLSDHALHHTMMLPAQSYAPLSLSHLLAPTPAGLPGVPSSYAPPRPISPNSHGPLSPATQTSSDSPYASLAASQEWLATSPQSSSDTIPSTKSQEAQRPGVMTRSRSQQTTVFTKDDLASYLSSATGTKFPFMATTRTSESSNARSSSPILGDESDESMPTSPELVPALSFAIGAATPDTVMPEQTKVKLTKREVSKFYFYTVLPEKGKLIWVVFFSRQRYSLQPFELLIHEIAQSPALMPKDATITPILGTCNIINSKIGCDSSLEASPESSPPSTPPSQSIRFKEEVPEPEGLRQMTSEFQSSQPAVSKPSKISLVLESVPELAWIAEGFDHQTGERLYQHKVCFQAPDSTYERRIFSVALHHRTERMMTLLGGLSFVSTTSQREHMWHRINQWFPGHAQKRLVQNCRLHPPSRRHFLNGKGSRQGSKHTQKDRFLVDEYEKAVALEVMNVTIKQNNPDLRSSSSSLSDEGSSSSKRKQKSLTSSSSSASDSPGSSPYRAAPSSPPAAPRSIKKSSGLILIS